MHLYLHFSIDSTFEKFLLQIARKAILTLMFSNDKQFVYRNCTNIFTVEAISNCAENCRSKSANDVWWEKHKLIHQNPRNQFKKKLTIFCKVSLLTLLTKWILWWRVRIGDNLSGTGENAIRLVTLSNITDLRSPVLKTVKFSQYNNCWQ